MVRRNKRESLNREMQGSRSSCQGDRTHNYYKTAPAELPGGGVLQAAALTTLKENSPTVLWDYCAELQAR
jgi:hypothetical protein